MKSEKKVVDQDNPETEASNTRQMIAGNHNMTESQAPLATEPEASDTNTNSAQDNQPAMLDNPPSDDGVNMPPTQERAGYPQAEIVLSEKDLKKREQLEAKVKNAVVGGWKALAEIQYYEEGRLWKPFYASFEDYVAARFDFNRKHSMRLVEAGRFLLQLDKGKATGPHPTRESHIREITQKLPESHRVQFWDKFCEANSINDKTVGEITALQVKEAVVAYRKELPKDVLPPKPARQKKEHEGPNVEKIRAKSVRLLEKVKVQVKKHPNQDSILAKLDELMGLING